MKNLKKKFDVRNALYASWFGISNPFGSDSFTTTSGFAGKVTEVMNSAILVAGLVAVILLVYSGYIMITAAGDSEKIEQGQQIITSTIIGLIIVFIARLGIVYLVRNVLHL